MKSFPMVSFVCNFQKCRLSQSQVLPAFPWNSFSLFQSVAFSNFPSHSSLPDSPQVQCLRAYKPRENDELALEKADVVMVTQQSSDGKRQSPWAVASIGVGWKYSLPRASVTKYHKVGGVKQWKCILLWFWRPEVQNQSVGRAILLLYSF